MEEAVEEEVFINIMSVQLPSQYRRPDDQEVILDVAYQRGNFISVIIPKGNPGLSERFRSGLKINDVQLYSPVVVFRSTCLITAVNDILSGPQKGGHALVMQVLNE